MEITDVLVTGGTGRLGTRLAERLRAGGLRPRVMSRSGRPGTVKGNLLTGEGLREAVDGTDAIIHAAQSPTRNTRETFVRGTERLLRAAEEADVSHVLYPSIVGIERIPLAYYEAKLESERVVERSLVPWTILRATQFHDLILGIIRPLARFPLVAPVPKGLLFQPMDAGEVADRLIELTLSGPAGRVPDVGGPEVKTLAELASAYLRVTGAQKRILELPLPGKAARALREGAQIDADSAWGTVTWGEFLRRKFVDAQGGR
jgi:uncharacterized protein YbjT (DUF2867 family)